MPSASLSTTGDKHVHTQALKIKIKTLRYKKSLKMETFGHFLREREEEGEKEKPNRSRSPRHPSPPTHIPITKRCDKNNHKIIKVLTLTEMTSAVGRRGDLQFLREGSVSKLTVAKGASGHK